MAKKKATKSAEKIPVPIDTRTPLDHATEVSARVQIKALILVDSSAKRTPEAVLRDIHIDLKLSEISVEPDQEHGSLVVLPTFSLKVTKKGEQDAAPMFSVQAKFAIMYAVSKMDDLKPEDFREFAKLNGIYNAWPYWREFVQSTAARMGLAPLTLPVYRWSANIQDAAAPAGEDE